MRSILFGVALLMGSLAMTSVASAHEPVPGRGGPRGGWHGHSHSYKRGYYGSRPYYAIHGRAFKGGYYYPGHSHTHFSYRVWSVTYSRFHYFDPYLKCEYYYCPDHCGYYPVCP